MALVLLVVSEVKAFGLRRGGKGLVLGIGFEMR